MRWSKRGYIMQCPREGTYTLLNCGWLYLEVVQIQHALTGVWDSEVKLTAQNLLNSTLTNGFV